MVYSGTASLRNAQRTGTALERVVRHTYDELVRILDRGGQHILGAHFDHVADDGTFQERLRNDLHISFLERSAERSRNFPPSLIFSLGRESNSRRYWLGYWWLP